jgi:hypothetical protein
MNSKKIILMSTPQGTHPTDDALENYALARLSSSEIAAVEEHFLVCQECRDRLREIDEYVAAMKQALTAVATQRQPVAPEPEGFLSKLQGLPKGVWAGAIATLALILVLLPLQNQPPPLHELQLEAYRGEAISLSATAPAGSALSLRLDLSGLAGVDACIAEVADQQGKTIYSAPLNGTAARRSVHLSEPLDAGQYWVRVYRPAGTGMEPGELLREFGLRIE